MRTLFVIAAALAGLILIACLGAAAALFTSPGRSVLVDVAERQIGASLGGEAEIGALAGAPPRIVELNDVALSGEEGPWLEISQISARWRPAALLRGRIEIDLIEIADAAVLGELPASPETDDASSAAFNLPRLPRSLPTISVDTFRIRNFRVTEAVAERSYIFDADGAAKIRPTAMDVAFSVREGGGADTLDLAMSFDARTPDQPRAGLELELESASDGALASLIDAGGPVSLRANADAPLSDFKIGLDADIGELMGIDAIGTANLMTGDAIALVGEARAGPGLPQMQEAVGQVVTLAANARAADDGRFQLEIEDLSADAGAVSGVIDVTAERDGRLKNVDARLQMAPRGRALKSISERLGDELELSARLLREGGDALPYAFDAQLTADMISAAFEDGRTDLSTRASGRLVITAPDIMPVAGLPGRSVETALIATIDAAAGGALAAEEIRLTLNGAQALLGAARVDSDANVIEAEARFDLAMDVANALLNGAEFLGPVSGDIAATGALDNFSVALNAIAPAIAVNGVASPPARLQADLTGLPGRPSASIDATDERGQRRLTAQFETDPQGAFAIPSISFTGAGFGLSGNAATSADFSNIALALTYAGQAGAEPFPGFRLVGDAAVEARLDSSRNNLAAAVTSDSLQVGDAAIEGLTFSVNGPQDSAPLSMSLDRVSSGGEPIVSELSLTGNVDAAASALRLDKASTFFESTQFRLSQPASFAFGDAIVIDGLRVSTSLGGELALNASLEPARWRARISASRFAPPGAPSLVDASISLDTDEKVPARGRISLLPVFSEIEATPVVADVVWDGRTARLRNADADDAAPGLEFDLAAPALLTRGDSLEVDFAGDVNGRVAYKGRAETLAKLGPAAAQTLEGDLDFTADISGAIDAPQLASRLSLTDGGYTEPISGLTLTHLRFDADASATGADAGRLSFSGEAAGANQDAASIFVNGEAALGETSNVDMRLSLKDAVVSAQYVSSLRANGDLRLAGALDALKASGALVINELNVEVEPPPAAGFTPVDITDPMAEGDAVAAARSDAPAGASSSADTTPVALDIRIDAPDRLFVRGLGLESEWSAGLSISGSSAAPLVLGGISLRRGYLDFTGRRFDLTEGEIAFDRLGANNPRLDLVAQYETSTDVIAALNVGGRAQTPEITLSSTPSLPREDVMALILFGKPAQELSAFESLQIAQALAQLSGASPFGGGGGGLTGGARSALGLDMLNLNLASPGGSQSLTVGKYVADGLFVSATQSARGDEGAVRVEYELTNSLSVESELQQDGDQTVSANWKTDF